MNEPLAKSNAKTVWQQNDDYYKPSVVIHGDEGIGIQIRGRVVVKTATQWQDLEQQLADLQHEARLNASMLARQTDLAREAEAKLAEKDAALGALAEALNASGSLFSGQPGSPKVEWYEATIFNEARLYDALGKEDARTVLHLWRRLKGAMGVLHTSPDAVQQAVAQYSEALAVVERVKAELVLAEKAAQYLAGEPATIGFFTKKLRALLGDAAQKKEQL